MQILQGYQLLANGKCAYEQGFIHYQEILGRSCASEVLNEQRERKPHIDFKLQKTSKYKIDGNRSIEV